MIHLARELLHRVLVAFGAGAFTLAFFLVLPLTQAITRPASADLTLQTLESAQLPPPPPPPEPEPEDEPEPEEPPPELIEESQPLDLSMLELALDPGGLGDGFLAGDFELLDTAASTADLDALVDLGDLDEEPRVIYQPGPVLSAKVRKQGPGTVWVIFIVDERGRVETPQVQSSPDPVFDRPALAAVSQWKFEPGKRNGKPVRTRTRVPITFTGE